MTGGETSGYAGRDSLYIPEIADDCSILDAAIVYAAAGFYVGPMVVGKNPGSILGKGWPSKTSREIDVLAAWFSGAAESVGLFIHCGRSGVVVFEVDRPKNVPDWMWPHLDKSPFQQSRAKDSSDGADARRGHYVFRIPSGVMYGNSEGGFKDFGFGEIRGRNGVIVVQPSPHAKAYEGGEYLWQRTGPVPLIPEELAERLPEKDPRDQADAAATDAETQQFLETHVDWVDGNEDRGVALLKSAIGDAMSKEENGSGRHQTMTTLLVWLMDDAAAGIYSAQEAYDQAHDLWNRWWRKNRGGECREDPTPGEFAGIAAWAVGQAMSKTDEQLQERRDRVGAKRGPAKQADRPRFNVTDQAVALEQLTRMIGVGPLSGVFRRGGGLVQIHCISEDGYLPPKEEDWEDGPAKVSEVGSEALGAILDHTHFVYKTVTAGGRGDAEHLAPKEVRVLTPTPLVRRVVAKPEYFGEVRPLRGVIHTPVLRSDFTLIRDAGYDERTGLVLMPEPGADQVDAPETPTMRQVNEAVALVLGVLDGFPFATEDDQANIIAAMLAPLIQHTLRKGSTLPLLTINAPMLGSGKTLLAQVLKGIHGGVFRPRPPEGEEETRKQITTILMRTTAPIVIWDNITGVFNSASVASLLTSPHWNDRILGATEDVDPRNGRLWVVTGNNVNLGGDMARRGLWVTIDSQEAEPWKRTGFAILNLQQYVADNRSALLSALFTLIRNWVVQGRPKAEEVRSDTFADFVASTQGILTEAGVAGTVMSDASNRAEIGADDEEWGAFLRALEGAFGIGRHFTVKDIGDLLDERFQGGDEGIAATAVFEALPGDLAKSAGRGDPINRTLGAWLKNHDGRFAGELVCRREGKDPHTKGVRYRLHRSSTSTA